MVHPQRKRRRRSPKIGRRHKKRPVSTSSNEVDKSPSETSNTSPSILDSTSKPSNESTSATTTRTIDLLEEETPPLASSKGPKGERMNGQERMRVRAAIDFIYRNKYHHRKDELKLTGRGGIVALISTDLGLHKNQHGIVRKNVLKSLQCIKNNIPFDPSDVPTSFPNNRRIKSNSFELELFNKYHEQGLSYIDIKNKMNVMHFKKKGLPLIGYNAVRNAAIREKNEIPEGTNRGWVVNQNEDGVLYEDDDVDLVPGVGDATKKKLEQEYEITKVIELALLTDDECAQHKLTRIRDHARDLVVHSENTRNA